MFDFLSRSLRRVVSAQNKQPSFCTVFSAVEAAESPALHGHQSRENAQERRESDCRVRDPHLAKDATDPSRREESQALRRGISWLVCGYMMTMGFTRFDDSVKTSDSAEICVDDSDGVEPTARAGFVPVSCRLRAGFVPASSDPWRSLLR